MHMRLVGEVDGTLLQISCNQKNYLSGPIRSVITRESAIYTVNTFENALRSQFGINNGVLDIDYFTIFPVLTAFCASVLHCSCVCKLPSPSKAYACCLRPFSFLVHDLGHHSTNNYSNHCEQSFLK